MTLIIIGIMLILALGIVTSSSFQSSYGATFGSSEYKYGQSDIFAYYFGILEFTEDVGDEIFLSCNNIDLTLKTDIIEINKEPLLNIDDSEDEFFIVLSQNGSDSYEYLQIALPQKNGSPSYLVDVKKESSNQLVTGGLYQADYPHLAFVFESDGKISVIDDENHYKKYFAGDSKSIVTPSERLDTGTYDFHAVLFQSDRSNGLIGERCAISLNWEFSVDSNGEITTKPPQTKIGMISDSTEKFPPLKQYKMGMGASQVECKKGHRLVEQEDYSNDKRIACVTPETKTKLIERGWTTQYSNDNKIRDTKTGTQEISLLPVYPKFDNGATEVINPDYESLEYRSTSPVIDDTYLSKNVQQWKDAWSHELQAEYEKYGDDFYIELGRLLMKNEMQYQMDNLGIVNAEEGFNVISGMQLQSLPPHIGFSSIVHATDGHYYWLQGMAHANQVNYYKTTQLQYPNPIKIEFGGGSGKLPDVIPQISILTKYDEDGGKDLKSVPPRTTVISQPGDVEFYNDTFETLTIYLNKDGLEEFSFETAQKIAIQSKSDAVWTFTEPGSYSWSGKIPIMIDDNEYELNTGGVILVLSDDMSYLSKEEKMDTARTMLLASGLPISGIGQQGNEDTFYISLSPAISEILPESKQYYFEAAQMAIPFDDISIMLDE
ncbi:hypothetical protein [Nitrosopumilus sp.]|uniref:hypothetical protein n=1 Tax=Nitrosopumilus sp. TaxID=2024843 RepID=UPI00292F3C33|nr:hypothetical protein [Nitrosopumilus sp.]